MFPEEERPVPYVPENPPSSRSDLELLIVGLFGCFVVFVLIFAALGLFGLMQ